MSPSATKGIAGFACWCMLAVPSVAWQAEKAPAIKRLYVEPFTTKAGSEKLREDVLAELRKLMSSISLVPSKSSADAVLGGAGEIWVKGYQSLNPRSGRPPSNGTPVYGGYLAVELRNTNGETLWSDLVTPAASSADVSKDISKRIARDVAAALPKTESLPPRASTPQAKTILKAAGATFPYPV